MKAELFECYAVAGKQKEKSSELAVYVALVAAVNHEEAVAKASECLIREGVGLFTEVIANLRYPLYRGIAQTDEETFAAKRRVGEREAAERRNSWTVL